VFLSRVILWWVAFPPFSEGKGGWQGGREENTQKRKKRREQGKLTQEKNKPSSRCIKLSRSSFFFSFGFGLARLGLVRWWLLLFFLSPFPSPYCLRALLFLSWLLRCCLLSPPPPLSCSVVLFFVVLQPIRSLSILGRLASTCK
jgi:hypothetical protein